MLLVFNVLAFLPTFSIVKTFFSTVLRLSFFWIFYLLSGIIFDIPFDRQVDFLLRLLLMLQLSVFISKSFALELFVSDMKPFIKYRLTRYLTYFFLYVNSIFKYIINHYKQAELDKERLSKDYLKKIMLLIKSVFDNTEEIKKDLPEIEITDRERAFFTFSNLYLFYIITAYTLAISL
jgi:hypothetical protein